MMAMRSRFERATHASLCSRRVCTALSIVSWEDGGMLPVTVGNRGDPWCVAMDMIWFSMSWFVSSIVHFITKNTVYNMLSSMVGQAWLRQAQPLLYLADARAVRV